MCFFMKVIEKKKIMTVQAKNAEEFDRKFDEASDRLEQEDVELRWDAAPMCVHFLYTERVKIPETVAEEFKLQGITYYCKDCPHLQKGKDRRERSHGCRYAEYGTVTDYTPACEFFLKQVLAGKIKPLED